MLSEKPCSCCITFNVSGVCVCVCVCACANFRMPRSSPSYFCQCWKVPWCRALWVSPLMWSRSSLQAPTATLHGQYISMHSLMAAALFTVPPDYRLESCRHECQCICSYFSCQCICSYFSNLVTLVALLIMTRF